VGSAARAGVKRALWRHSRGRSLLCYREREEDDKLDERREFDGQGHTALEANEYQEKDHRAPLPASAAETIKAIRETEEVAGRERSAAEVSGARL